MYTAVEHASKALQGRSTSVATVTRARETIPKYIIGHFERSELRRIVHAAQNPVFVPSTVRISPLGREMEAGATEGDVIGTLDVLQVLKGREVFGVALYPCQSLLQFVRLADIRLSLAANQSRTFDECRRKLCECCRIDGRTARSVRRRQTQLDQLGDKQCSPYHRSTNTAHPPDEMLSTTLKQMQLSAPVITLVLENPHLLHIWSLLVLPLLFTPLVLPLLFAPLVLPLLFTPLVLPLLFAPLVLSLLLTLTPLLPPLYRVTLLPNGAASLLLL